MRCRLTPGRVEQKITVYKQNIPVQGHKKQTRRYNNLHLPVLPGTQTVGSTDAVQLFSVLYIPTAVLGYLPLVPAISIIILKLARKDLFPQGEMLPQRTELNNTRN